VANRERLKLIQTAQARLMRRPRPKRETPAMERAENPVEETQESPEFERREHGGSAPAKKSRTGTMAPVGASVGGGT
jgi:hypothetical protein